MSQCKLKETHCIDTRTYTHVTCSFRPIKSWQTHCNL